MGGGIGNRGTNRLSDRAIRAFVAKRRAGENVATKLSDGGGLFLTHTPAGTPVWRLKYRLGGKERLYAIGTYPEVGLEAARSSRESVKTLLREGRDPVTARRVDRATAASSVDSTFASLTEAWLGKRKGDWSGVHYEKSRQALERDVLPTLGRLPVSDITPAMVTSVVERILKRGVVDTAAKVLHHVTGVFRLAQANGLCTDNPALPAREILPRKRLTGRRPALLELKELRDLLRRAELASLSPSVRLANRLCAFTASRVGNVVEARWSEFQLEADPPTWTIPRAKMKARDRSHDHVVVLGPTIAAELRAWRTLTGGDGYLFPSPQGSRSSSQFISREALEKVYRETLALADKHSPHGWRASFSTLARDNGFARDVVELTLDHVHDNEVVRAYDRGERLTERVRLMNWWDSQLMGAAQ